MKTKGLVRFVLISMCVLFTYAATSAQQKEIVNSTKVAAEKTKDAVVDGSKKTAEVTKAAAEKSAKAVKTFGNNAVEVTENVVAKPIEKGRYYTVKTWNGTKWVSKQVWFATKKAATAVKDAVKP